MKYLAVALIYASFFGLIGSTCYFTKSAMPLWALLLTPDLKMYNKKEDKKGEDEE
jgi:hypothetical protein